MRTVRLAALLCSATLPSCDLTDPAPPLIVLARAAGHDRVVAVDERIPVSVRAIGDGAKPMAGVTVLWSAEPGGNLARDSTVTAQDGVASTELRVRFGVNRIVARIPRRDATAIELLVHGCSRCGEWSRAVDDAVAMAHSWGGAAAVGDQVWVVGGLTTTNTPSWVSVLDPVRGTWRKVLELPTRLIGPVAVALDGELFVLGGAELQQGMRNVAALEVSATKWTGKASLLTGRYYAAGASLDGKIYVVGGHDSCNFDWCPDGPEASLEIYDPVADRWTSGPRMLTARASAGAAVLDGKLYVAGGTGGAEWEFDGPISSVEMFDPAVARWVSRANLPVSGPTRLVVMDGTLLAFVAFLDGSATRTYEYDVERDAWNRLYDAPSLLYGSVFVPANGRIYALGGYSIVTNTPPFRQFSDGAYTLRR